MTEGICDAGIVIDFDSIDCTLPEGHAGSHFCRGEGGPFHWMEPDERARIEQSNEVAGIVIVEAQKVGIFPLLDFRYGVADALYAAGYRKVTELENRS